MRKMDMIDYLSSQGHYIERAGASVYRCCCPIHTERTPSFYIYPNGHAYCYGACDCKYDIVELLYRLEFPEDQTRRRAFEKARAMRLIPDNTATRYRQPIQLPEPTEEQVEAMTAVMAVYTDMLHRRVGFGARTWLRETRGLSGPLFDHIIEGLGYAPDGAQYQTEVIAALKKISKKNWVPLAISIGILSARGRQKLRKRIIFPVRNKQGQVLYYQARTILSDEELQALYEEKNIHLAKHLNVPGIRKIPYEPIPKALATHKGTYIDEGPMDALAHATNGFYSLALLGSHIPYAPTLVNLPYPIIGCLDNDEGLTADGKLKAGPRAQQTLLDRCRENAIPFLDGTCPTGVKDPSKLLQVWGERRFTTHYAQIAA